MDPTEIKDMVTANLDVYWPKEGGPGGGKGYIQIAQKFQRYAFYGLLLQENRLSFDGGLGITTTLMDKLSESAEWVGFFQGGTVSFTDLFFTMSVDYKWIRNHWPYDIKEKWIQSRSASKIADVIQARDEACTLGLIQKVEETAWNNPDTTLTKEMLPIPFWVVWDDTQDGFFGKYPNGFTAFAGADLDKHPNFQNYTHRWTDGTAEDLLRAWRKTHMKTNFVSPLDVNDFRGVSGQNFRIYTNDEGMLTAWELNEKRKDTLAWDMGSQDNQTTFKGNQFVYTPALDSDNVTLVSANNVNMAQPFYFLNKNTFHVVVLTQDFMRRHPPMNDSRDPDTFVNWKYLSVQTMCSDRRSNGLVAKAA